MRKLLTILFLVVYLSVNATDFFIKNSGGTGSGLDHANAWSKAHFLTQTLSPNNRYYFNRGETFNFTSTWEIEESGTVGNLITFGAYGTGADPIITGFNDVSAWTDLGSNIWESTSAVSTLSTLRVVSINGVNTAMGRYPNSTWLYNSQANHATQVSEATLNSAVTNWTGAELVIRKNRWIIDRCAITAHSGTQLTFTNPTVYPAWQNWGFFLQNDVRTLDVQNEWYYNPSTKKLRIYSTSSPTNVKVSAIEDLVYFIHIDYLKFENIQFTGANRYAIYPVGLYNTVDSCNFDFNYNGIKGDNWGAGQNSAYFTVTNSTFNNTNNTPIDLGPEFKHCTLTNNDIRNSSILIGMGEGGDLANCGIISNGDTALIQYNTIVNTNYCGIYFQGDGTQIRNNFIDSSCMVKDDGGAIYTYQDNDINKIIDKNTCLNTLGTNSGTDDEDGDYNAAYAIYIDGDVSGGVDVTNNNIAYTGGSGIFLHNSHDINCTGNTVYDSKQAAILIGNNTFGATMTDLVVTGNIFVTKDAPIVQHPFGTTTTAFNRTAMYIISSHNDLADPSTIGTFNNNVYARPIQDDTVFTVSPNGETYTPGGYLPKTLAQWKTYSGMDASSTGAPMSISDTEDLRFEYNHTAEPVDISLPYNYMDMTGANYNETITLAPYSSAVLILNVIPGTKFLKSPSNKIYINNGKIMKQ